MPADNNRFFEERSMTLESYVEEVDGGLDGGVGWGVLEWVGGVGVGSRNRNTFCFAFYLTEK